MNQSPEKEKGMSFIKKAGKWAPLVGGAWIVLNIVVPLALLRIPVVQKYLVVLRTNYLLIFQVLVRWQQSSFVFSCLVLQHCF